MSSEICQLDWTLLMEERIKEDKCGVFACNVTLLKGLCKSVTDQERELNADPEQWHIPRLYKLCPCFFFLFHAHLHNTVFSALIIARALIPASHH
jgi:hypothetical protein